eukprot:392725-Pyramimonas_sp.AAC.1
MGTEGRAASLTQRRCGLMSSPSFSTMACIDDASLTSPMHRQCIRDAGRFTDPYLLRALLGGFYFWSR